MRTEFIIQNKARNGVWIDWSLSRSTSDVLVPEINRLRTTFTHNEYRIVKREVTDTDTGL